MPMPPHAEVASLVPKNASVRMIVPRSSTSTTRITLPRAEPFFSRSCTSEKKPRESTR